jgi:D-alanine--poly(phosphoribitol) ligase subunit 2
MNTHNDDLLGLVYACVDDLNKQLPPEARLSRTAQTVLVGTGGVLDSLSLINFLVSVEEAVAARFGTEVPLLGDPQLGDESGPFHTLSSLAALLSHRLR